MQYKREIWERTPWIEKYRPRTIQELILDEDIYSKVEQFIKNKEIPNLFITGIPGVGKTTTLKCIAKAFYGKHINNGFLEINASDDRGSKLVDEILNFCNRKLDLNDNDNNNGIIYSNHKIVFLDEADNLTPNAQLQINNIMKKYNNKTRFAFTSNDSSKIIESIQSNCLSLKYKRLSTENVIIKLKQICKLENVIFTEDGLEAIADISQGDIRSSINSLQRVYQGIGKVTKHNVYEICDKPQPIIIENLFKLCMKKDLLNAMKVIYDLREKGFSDSDIILSMLSSLKLNNLDIPEDIKIKFSKYICNSAYIISKGLDNSIQTDACIASMILN
jgi:replication factor C subunit 2/4